MDNSKDCPASWLFNCGIETNQSKKQEIIDGAKSNNNSSTSARQSKPFTVHSRKDLSIHIYAYYIMLASPKSFQFSNFFFYNFHPSNFSLFSFYNI